MKYPFYIFLFILFSFSLNAQVINSIGFKGGTSIATQSWKIQGYSFSSESIEVKNLSSVYFAISAETDKSKYFSIGTDLGFCQKGSRIKISHSYTDPFGTIKNRTYVNENFINRFNFIQISPYLKTSIKIKDLIAYALLGIRLDFLIAVNSDIFYPFDNYFKSGIYHFTYGLISGGGVEYRIKKIGVTLEFQYQPDFNNIVDVNASYRSLEIKNRALITCGGLKIYFQFNENQEVNQYENKN